MKVIFAGTPEFSVPPLQALCEHHEVVGVYTQPDRKSGRGKKLTAPPVKLAAQAQNIPVHQPDTLRDQCSTISAYQADVMVVVAYGMLLPQTILDIPPLGCINIHASLLPRWRGAAPIHRAIEAGDTQTGVSIMRMELGLDTGPVYQTLSTPISDVDTSADLHDRLAKLGAQGIVETLSALSTTPTLQPVEQDHQRSTYAKKIKKEEANIDWNQSATAINQKIRAFIPWPGGQTHHQSDQQLTRLRIWRTSIELGGDASPGKIININEHGVLVACGDGALRLEVLQRDGSKALPYKDFSNGYSLGVGDQLT